MTQTLEIFQSSWALELRRPDGFEWSLEEKFNRVAAAGYDGISIDMASGNYPTAERLKPLFEQYGLANLLVAFPTTVESLNPVFDMANTLSSRFVAINAKYFPFTPQEGAQYVRAALALAATHGVEAHFELHRLTLTNDLFYTAQLMDLVPEMELIADLSHAVVGREIEIPIDEIHERLFFKVIDRAAGLQGRIANREQIQISVTWPQHQQWVDLFEKWWIRAMSHWRTRKGPNAILNFLCELGPAPYAITGADGYELVDRWEQALILKSTAERLWHTST